MKQNWKQQVGEWGEQRAAAFFARHGYDLVCMNYHCPHGEIDLIVFGHDELVFVEVKTRSNAVFGLPAAAVDARKQQKLMDSAQYYLQNEMEKETDWRIDVIAIQGKPFSEQAELIWYENAITGS
ncbi:MAG: YraN family protein [Anaerolineaceae bacterium]|nr:YraN family protein [Anaerolineaceae bacterium]